MAGALMSGVVGAVTGDVALAEGVEPEQVIEAGHGRVEVVGSGGEVVGGREHDEVAEDPPVGTPVPAGVGRVGLAPWLRPLQPDDPVGAADHRIPHSRPVRKPAVDGGEIESSGYGNTVPVEAVRIEHVVVMARRTLEVDEKRLFVGGEEHLDGRPVELVIELVVVVRTPAERTVVIGREQHRTVACRAVGDPRCVEQPCGVRGVDAGEHPRTVRGSRGQIEGRRRGRTVQHPFGGILVRPHRYRRPFGAVDAMERHTCERLAGRHLHAQHPVELPTALGQQLFVDRGDRPVRRPVAQRALTD